MRVVAVPNLTDNYAYLVIDGDRAAVVDPGEFTPIEEALVREGVTLAAIWLTHHHPDHTGGVVKLVRAHPGIEVVAHAHDRERAPEVRRGVEHDSVVELGAIRASIIYNPGHTL